MIPKHINLLKPTVNIFWFRRDLRLDDNTALYHALQDKASVLPIFIFDPHILDQLENKQDRRVEFIYNSLQAIQQVLIKASSSLEVYYANPLDVFKQLQEKYNIGKVFTNHDYEPYAIERDKIVEDYLSNEGIYFNSFKDQVVFERDEVIKDDGKPYTVFTPYSRKWHAKLEARPIKISNSKSLFNNLYKQQPVEIPSLGSIGFKWSNQSFPSSTIGESLLKNYAAQRDFPGINGTSMIGMHLRFGTISIRELVLQARALSDTFLNELIWREFFQSILWHFPRVGKGQPFRQEYDLIRWRDNEKDFERWCKGMTGYPIVDAGMRQLNETGFMHNRVRMITASFLAKHLLIDWRWGEAYFAEKLLDFELASNNGNWQWAAGCGCDAAPYFRIFNPALQTKKFDPELKYVKQWVPELNELSYPQPIVEHEYARKRCLETYGRALKKEMS